MNSRFEQNNRAVESISFTECGISSDFKLMHSSNARGPMYSIPSCNVIFSNE